jgi:hypothetical protein
MTAEAVPAGSGRSGWGTRVLAVVAIAVAGAVVWATAAVLQALGHVPPTLKATPAAGGQGAANVVTLSLATYPDSMSGVHGASGGAHPEWVTYGPSTTLSVPAYSLVKMTIKNYDTASTLNDTFFAQVQGTVGGVASYDGKPLSKISPDAVAHTFTIHMFPTSGQPALDVSVPLLGVPDNAPALADGYPKPEVVTFEFRTGAPGRYIWQCFDPCGQPYFAGFGGPMATLGYMAGTITVGGAHA